MNLLRTTVDERRAGVKKRGHRHIPYCAPGRALMPPGVGNAVTAGVGGDRVSFRIPPARSLS